MHLERNWKLYSMKRKIFLFLIVLFSHQIFAQTNFNALYLQTYRQAIDFYNNQEYGKALKYAEDSIVYKKDLIQSEVDLLVNSLAPKEVSSVGEKIDNVLKILTEREDKDAIDIINKQGYSFDKVLQIIIGDPDILGKMIQYGVYCAIETTRDDTGNTVKHYHIGTVDTSDSVSIKG